MRRDEGVMRLSEGKSLKPIAKQEGEGRLNHPLIPSPLHPIVFDGGFMQNFWQDLRYGARMLVKNPGFTAIAVLTLALGIGANTAIFSVVNSLILRPLAYPHAERLMTIWENHQANGGPQREWTSPPGFEDWRDQAQSFDHVIAFQGWQPTLTDANGQGEPEQLTGALVSHDVFDMLGVKPVLGQGFLPQDDQPGVESKVIISYGLWQRRFAADPQLIGKTISLNGESRVVLGVMPAGFKFPIITNSEIWRPIRPVLSPGCQRGCITIRVMARLKEGVSEAQARSELETIASGIEQQFPETNARVGVTLLPLQDFIVGPARTPVIVLLVAVALVLLIACVNVANLLLARATGREKEMAVRASLGAGRWRIVRQLLAEGLLLATVGSAVGLLMAYWLLDVIVALAPQNTPRLDEIALDQRALFLTLAVTLLTGIFFGLAPAWQISRVNLNQSLKDGSKGAQGAKSSRRTLGALVVAETALALMLLIGAGLLMKSFINLQKVNPGYNPTNILTAVVSLPSATYPSPQVRTFHRQLLEHLATLPGVQAVGAISSLPLAGFDNDNDFVIEGRPKPLPNQQPVAWANSTSVDYFRTMGIQLRDGRSFTDRDTETAPKVALISETFARRYFPDETPLGKRIGNGNPDNWTEIVGVVADVKQFGLSQDARVTMYFPLAQRPARRLFYALRTTAEPLSQTPVFRNAVATLDKNLAVSDIQTMQGRTAQSIGQERFTLLLFGLFAALALILAAAGIYGVMSYSVAQRTHEIGIRQALGAQTRDVLALVLREGLLLVLIGAAIGVSAALLLTSLMEKLLFGVSPTDPLTFVGVAGLLAAVALLACYLPARRATRVDPMEALRYE
jgi:putative ABC transport system permease protein